MIIEREANPFTNFSRLAAACPRCGEENDKCGVFENTGFVLCRTELDDGAEPRLDANGWEYWPYQIGDSDAHFELYEKFYQLLDLSLDDRAALGQRGLSDQQIDWRGYKTIPYAQKLSDVLTILNQSFDLTGVPGFFTKDGQRKANVVYKQTLIPVRNFYGRITQFVLRNNNVSDNKRKSKYLLFSSDKKEDGAPIKPQIHFPLGAKEAGSEIRVTEGILKADLATSLGKFYCIGLHGLGGSALHHAVDLLGASKVRLAIDIDWQTNSNVLNGLRRLYRLLVDKGYEVTVEEWNAADGKGIDDVLLSKGKIWELPAEEAEYLLECPRWDRNDWAYINKTSQFAKVKRKPIYLMDEKHFSNHFAKLKEDYHKDARLQVQQADSLTYRPLGPRLLYDNELVQLNLWCDTGIGPEFEGGDLTLFHAHMDYLFQSDKYQKELMLDWMANIVQNRGKKFSYALVLHGDEGTGKTWIIQCLSLILGESNVGTVSNEYINGTFNGLLEAKELLIVNEIMAGGRRDFMNKMKDYIDAKTITINKKSVPEYEIPFHTNWFMTTNYDDALLIDDKDRRYLVLSSDAKCGDEKEADARGEKLFRWSGGGKEEFPLQVENLSALHRFLLKRKVGHNPFAKAPLTQAKVHMQEESLPLFDKFVKERIEEEMWPFNSDLICIEHIKMMPSIDKKFGKVSPHRWGKVLRKFGAVPYGCKLDTEGNIIEEKKVRVPIRTDNKKRRYIWLLRRHSTYAVLEPSEIEELYIKKRPVNDDPAGGKGLMEEEPM